MTDEEKTSTITTSTGPVVPERPYARDDRGRFLPGTCGKLPGTRNRFRNIFGKRLDAASHEIVDKVLEAIRNGDSVVLSKFVSYGLSKIKMNPIQGLDGKRPGRAVLDALTAGQITPDEGAMLARVVQTVKLEEEMERIKNRLEAIDGKA